MKRIFTVITALALVAGSLALAAPAGAVSCANPTTLNGYEGTIQYPGQLFVQQDVWQQIGEQHMLVCGISRWDAIANQSGTPETGVKAYPDSQQTFTDWQNCSSQPRVDSFKTLRGKFAAHTADAGSFDFAWDIFLNGGVCNQPVREIMLWNQWRDISVPDAQANVTVGGTNYDVYHSAMSASRLARYHELAERSAGHSLAQPNASGSSYIQMRQTTQTTSGKVNFKAVFKYLEKQGLMSPADTAQFDAYGAEILTTFGVDQTFSITKFAVHYS